MHAPISLAAMAMLTAATGAIAQDPTAPSKDVRPALVLRQAELMTRTPAVNAPGVKVWTMRRDGMARTNLVEFTGRSALHLHPDADHTLLVMQGTVWVRAGDEQFSLAAGDYISIPPNLPHTYWVEPGQRALLVSFDAPAYDERKIVWLEPR
jgi:mannose-6-phosphate isomerase-like protein (cupin superfamily)